MNYRERIRKAIECPQFGYDHYGEWGTLGLEQKKLIRRLLDELDSADEYVKHLYFENMNLKDKISTRIKTIINIIKEQPTDNIHTDMYIIEALNSLLYILNEVEENESN